MLSAGTESALSGEIVAEVDHNVKSEMVTQSDGFDRVGLAITESLGQMKRQRPCQNK